MIRVALSVGGINLTDSGLSMTFCRSFSVIPSLQQIAEINANSDSSVLASAIANRTRFFIWQSFCRFSFELKKSNKLIF